MEIENKKKFLINFTYISVCGILIFLLCKFLISYLLPFLIATVIAFLMQRPAAFLSEKTGLKKGRIAALLSALIYLATVLLAVFLLYKGTVFLMGFTEKLPEFLNKISNFLNQMQMKFSSIISENHNAVLGEFWKNFLSSFSEKLGDLISKTIAFIAKNMPSFLFSSIIALVASCYIAKDYNILVNFIKELCGKARTENIKKVKEILFNSVFKLLKGYLILMLLTFLELLIGLMLLRVKNAVLIAFLVSFVDILPVIGLGAVLIPWAVVSALSNKVTFAIGLAVLYIASIVIRNFLEPKIIGTQIGINPLFTLLAMFVGLKVLGVFGLFLFPIILIVVIKYYKNQMIEGLSVSSDMHNM